jgi:hypothetical protein
MHALQSLLLAGCSAVQGAAEVVFQVYSAKRSAELAPGVGNSATDIFVCTHDGTRRLDSAVLTELDATYKSTVAKRHPTEGYGKLKGLLDGSAPQA